MGFIYIFLRLIMIKIHVIKYLLFLLPLTLQAQTLPQFMEEVREGSYAAVPESIWQQEERELLQELQPFLQDTSQSVRLRAYGIAKQAGLNSDDLELRQEVVARLIAGIGDTDRSISVRNTSGLKNFLQQAGLYHCQCQPIAYLPQHHHPKSGRAAFADRLCTTGKCGSQHTPLNRATAGHGSHGCLAGPKPAGRRRRHPIRDGTGSAPARKRRPGL